MKCIFTLGIVFTPVGAYLVTQNSAKNAPKHVILTLKIRKFSAAVAQPLP